MFTDFDLFEESDIAALLNKKNNFVSRCMHKGYDQLCWRHQKFIYKPHFLIFFLILGWAWIGMTHHGGGFHLTSPAASFLLEKHNVF